MNKTEKLNALKKSAYQTEPTPTHLQNNEKKKRDPLSTVVIFLAFSSIIHFLTFPFFLNYLNLVAQKVSGVDALTNAIVQVMSYTGQLFFPFFDMINRTYLGNSQQFANTSVYVITALFVLQLIAGIGLLLRSKIAWYYQFALNDLALITGAILLFQPGFYPVNAGVLVWPAFVLLLLFEGSVLHFVHLKRSWKLVGFVLLSSAVLALVLFGGSVLLKDVIGSLS